MTMPDDIESLARRAGVEAIKLSGALNATFYDMPAVAAMLAQMRREVEAQAEQDAKRYRWLQDWYLREGLRKEIDPHGHVRQTTPGIMDAAIDAALRRLAEKG